MFLKTQGVDVLKVLATYGKTSCNLADRIKKKFSELKRNEIAF